MKYNGNIIGIQPSNATSIYNVVTSDGAIIWHAKIFAQVEESNIQLAYNYEGDAYNLILKKIKEGYYSGDLLYTDKKCGECFLYVYERGNGLLMKGDYKDDWSGQWEVFIELNEPKG